MGTVALRRIALVAALIWCAACSASDTASVPGVAWRSILPTGTKAKSVYVAPFRIDRRPVTNEAFLAFVRNRPEWRRGSAPAALADAGYLRQWTDALAPVPGVGLRQPVTSVSWFAARAYCENQGARLPTWYEWEVAAAADNRTPDARKTPGWQQTMLNWYSRPSTVPLAQVGEQPPNFHGIHDLHGLVWEWVEDFNALMVSGDSREQGDPDLLKFCGSGALALEDRDNYALAMRLALLSSVQANATTINLGFRCAAASPADALPSDSVYQIDPALQTADGRKTSFSATRGRPRIVTMFYASCPMACPLTIDTLRNLDAALPPAERARLGVLMLSMDPERDTPAALSALASERNISDRRWILARASPADTRKLAALLGIQYRRLDTGDFDHSSALILLDAQGRQLARSQKLGTPDPEFLAKVRAALAQDAPRIRLPALAIAVSDR